ncbi:MAG: thioesterase [Actinobacteria bacterium]|nr:thioesterase [Actinomycetota bacterium]
MVETPVLCLPFAGAGASAFRRAQEYPAEHVRIVPLQLPGREERFGEEALTDAASAVDDLLPVALDLVAGSPAVAVFGHSLGAVLAFELAHRLRQLPQPDLVRVFVSGSPGPWTRREVRATGLTDEDFLHQVRGFAGYRHPALEHPELREMLLPALRADVEMHENYLAQPGQLIDVPIISIRGGEDELVSAEQAAEWQAATTAGCRLVEVSGNHMYLIDSPVELVRLMDAELAVPQ